MLYNEETKKVLFRSGLGWLIPLLPKDEKGKEITHEFSVALIDLDVLGIGPYGHHWGDGSGFWAWERVVLFDEDGQQIAEVGGKKERVRTRTKLNLKKWPFFFRVPELYKEDTFETVGEVIQQLSESEVNAIRYVVVIPTSLHALKIYKLRKSDKNLRTRLQEKVDEAVAETNRLLQE